MKNKSHIAIYGAFLLLIPTFLYYAMMDLSYLTIPATAITVVCFYYMLRAMLNMKRKSGKDNNAD